MCSAFGLTGYTGPWNPSRTMLETMRCPRLLGSREAPTTATEEGLNIGRNDAATKVREVIRLCTAPSGCCVRVLIRNLAELFS